MLERAYAILEPMFVDSVLPESGHGLLASSDRWEPLLDSLPDAAKKLVGENLKQKWSGIKGCQTSPAEKWEELLEHLNVCFGTKSSTDTKVKVKRTKNVSESDREQIENWPVQVVLEHTYPRLDINVSKMQNHLLKSPFCVHPKTGRVCVPISVEKIDEFDPFAVPTLAALMKELDEAGSTPSSADKNKDDKSKESWHKTSLKAYFEPFQKDFLEPLLTDLRRQARDKAEEQAAVIGDF
jgi:DNA primase small subunit